MRFFTSMAARELRASWRRLIFFFVCIAVGVAAIVALRSVIQSVRAGIAGQARSLLAADLLLTSNNGFGPKVRGVLDAERRAGRIAAVQPGHHVVVLAAAEYERRELDREPEGRHLQWPVVGDESGEAAHRRVTARSRAR